jgi:hypothetical protein
MRWLRIIPSNSVRRAVLVISIGQAKIDRLRERRDEKRLLETIRKLAQLVREQDGVREVQAVTFAGWADKAARGREPEPPWTPYGVVVTVEATGQDELSGHIDNIFRQASTIDQEMMTMNGLDNW